MPEERFDPLLDPLQDDPDCLRRVLNRPERAFCRLGTTSVRRCPTPGQDLGVTSECLDLLRQLRLWQSGRPLDQLAELLLRRAD